MDRSRTEDEQTRTRDVDRGTRQPSEDDQSWRREHNSLEVTIISAQGLRDTRIFGKMSSYALAWIDSDVKYCTHVAHNAGCNPAWDHKMYIALPPMGTELNVQIFSRGSGNNDPLVGSTKIPLAHVSHSGLQYMACQLLTPSGRIQGLLNISVRTCTSDSEALESSTLKRSIEVSGSFKAPNSDSPVGDDGDEYDRTGIDLSDPASSSCQTPAPRHRRHSGKFTAPDILDFGAVEDPGNPVQQRERRERDWEKEREQRERERERERERDRERERERQQERDRERERGQWEKERDRDRERERERDRERERERSRGQTTERDRERERSRGQLTGVSGGTSGTGGSGGGTTGGDQAGGDLGGSNTVDGGALGTYYLGSAMDHLPGQ